MAEVRPFIGLRYSPDVVGPLGGVLCPPYDVISPDDRVRLLERSPYNAVRLELPSECDGLDRYQSAARTLERWRREGVLVAEAAPAVYVVRHEFEGPAGRAARTELTALVRLEPLEGGAVRPHETTRAGPKEDRLRLMEATSLNVSPIMLLYPDAPAARQALERAQRASPLEADLGGGERLAIWPVRDPQTLAAVRDALAPEPLYLADGHHRYETALAYRERACAAAPAHRACHYVLASLVALADPGLLSLPYHRVLRGLDREALGRLRARLEAVGAPSSHPMPGASPGQVEQAALEALRAPDALFEVWGLEPASRTSFRLRGPAAIQEIALAAGRSRAWAGLAPVVFREAVLRPALGVDEQEAEARGWLTFAKSGAEAVAAVDAGAAQLAVMPRPVPMDALREVSDRGERLPPKSTYFHPKLPTGVAFSPLDATVG